MAAAASAVSEGASVDWILVTGGAGYIGSHTVVELVAAGYGCVVADNFVNSSPRAVDRVKEISGKPELIMMREVDFCDAEAVAALFAERSYKAVIHFAGLKAVGESVEKPLLYYENNIMATIVLLKEMEKAGCGLLIFSSSATVYGSGSTPPFAETAPTGVGVTNPYGWTKFMLEQVLRDTAAANPSLRVVLLRYFNPVGAHESGKIGEDPAGRPNNLMPFVLQVAIGRRDRLTIYGDDYATADGTAERDYVHVVDLARGHVAALRAYEEGPPAAGAADEAAHPRCAVLNLGTGVPCSVKQVVDAMGEALGRPLPHEIGPRRPGDLGSVFADASKAEAVLGWKATRSLADMCADGWRWQQANPWGYRTEEEAKAMG